MALSKAVTEGFEPLVIHVGMLTGARVASQSLGKI
jgi:hypothetical protein